MCKKNIFIWKMENIEWLFKYIKNNKNSDNNKENIIKESLISISNAFDIANSKTEIDDNSNINSNELKMNKIEFEKLEKKCINKWICN